MTGTEMWTLFFVLLPALGAILGAISIYNIIKKHRNRFRFFAVRDELVGLVAEGKLEENSFIFKDLYRLINHVVNHTQKFNFKTLVHVFKEDLSKDEKFQKLESEYRKATPDVQRIIDGFGQSVLDAIHDNSHLFKMVARVLRTFNSVYLFAKFCQQLIPDRFKTAYKIEKNINRLCGAN